MGIIVLGSGNFGSCLADHLADQGSNVQLWARSSDVVNSINSSHKHPRYLKDHVFDKRLTAIGPNLPDPAQLAQCDALVFAIPTQVLRSLLRQLQLDKLERVPLLIFVNKVSRSPAAFPTLTHRLVLRALRRARSSCRTR